MKKLLVFLLILTLCIGLTACTDEEAEAATPLILGLLIGIGVNIGFSCVFASIADQKGHSYGTYFTVCFFFSIIGYILVAALPQNNYSLYNLERKIEKLAERIESNPVPQSAPAPMSYSAAAPTTAPTANTSTLTADGRWICGNCKTSNSMNYGQCKKCSSYRKTNYWGV